MLKEQFHTSYSKIWGEGYIEGVVRQKEPEFEDLGIQLVRVVKTEKAYSEEDTKDVIEQPFDEEISMSINWKLNQFCQ